MSGIVKRAWGVAGGCAFQDAFVTAATVTAGAHIAQEPHHNFSVWNDYRFHSRIGAGLGDLRRADRFGAIDNTVTPPGYRRADAAAGDLHSPDGTVLSLVRVQDPFNHGP